jgi:hypothetical protein
MVNPAAFDQTPTSLFGLRVFVTPDHPNMQLAPGDYVTPEFRKEIDAWLLEFFGTFNLLEDTAYLFQEQAGIVHMNPRAFAKLKGIQ